MRKSSLRLRFAYLLPVCRRRWHVLPAALVVLVAWAVPAGAGWLTLTTPHTRVHFQPGYELAAIEAARAAEQAIEALQTRLGYEPQEPVHLALVDSSDLSNGFTDVAYYSRIIIFPAFPVGLGYATGLSPRMSDWLKLVVTHEVVHAVHLDMAAGPARGIRQIFGHVPGFSTPNLFQPVAFIEGLATFEETELVEGGRGKDPLFDMFLRAAVLESALPDLDEALGHYDLGRFQPAGHVYLYGYAWFEHVARRFGPEAIRDLQQRFAGSGGPVSLPGDVVRRVLGEDMESLWRGMRQELETRYRYQIDTIRAAGETKPSVVEPARDSGAWIMLSPRVSPDGRYLAYAAAGPYVEDLRLVDLQSGRDRQLALGLTTAPGGLDWSRDGRYVIYAAAEDVGGRLLADLYRVEVATGRVERLTHGRRAYAPAAGPAGKVAFVAREGLATRIMVRDGSGAVRPLWEPPPGWQLLSLAWSPDGERLAVSAWKPGGGADILVLRLEGVQTQAGAGSDDALAVRQELAVTDDPFVDERPSWSPDGRYVLFHSDRDGVYNLYAYDTQEGKLWRLTNVVTGAFDPAMSPDGGTVFFSWFGATGYRLARLARSELRWELAPLPAAAQAPQASVAPSVEGLPASWRIGPYDPLESLRPTYWEPLIGEQWPGPFLGAATAGQDALGRRAYALAGAVGLSTGAPVLYAGYARLLGDEGAPVLTLEASVAPEVSSDEFGAGVPVAGDPFQEVATAAARLSWQRNGYTSGWAGAAQVVRSWTRAAYPESEPWSSGRRETWLVGSLLKVRRSGEHRWTAAREWSLDSATALELAGSPVNLLRASQLVAGWRYSRQRIDGSGFRLGMEAGISGGEPEAALQAGGDDGPFALRAFEPGALEPVPLALGVSAERSWRLAALRFGMGDAPMFLDDLKLALFTEAAAGWAPGDSSYPLALRRPLNPAPWSPAVDVGAELRLSASLDYGRLGLELRIGVAHALAPGPATRWYIRLEAR